jgi:hypothetical protein
MSRFKVRMDIEAIRSQLTAGVGSSSGREAGTSREKRRTLTDQKPDANSTHVEPIQELLNAQPDPFGLLGFFPFVDTLTADQTSR